MKLLKKNIHLLTVLAILALFGLLLFKDPFSARSLIPNLEPFPDSIYYIVPARNLAGGHGLIFSREGRGLNPNIPPLYSLIISPIYFISQDPRMFYFVNIFLGLSSFCLFYKILNHLTKNSWITNISLFFYVTNYFLYWYPTIPMAENLNLTIYLFGLWLLLQPLTLARIILMAFLPVSLVETKYANLPLTITFLAAFSWKVIFQLPPKEKVTKSASFFLSLLISVLLFLGYEYVFKNHNILEPVFSLFNRPTLLKSDNQKVVNSWFSIQYLNQNLPIYLKALIGQPIRFLWGYTPIIPVYIGVVSLVGLIVGGIQKDNRLISLVILVSIFSTILFLSTFYSADGRYIYFAIPSLLIGLTILLDFLQKFRSYRKILSFVLICLLIFYSVTNFNRIKSQISLNFKYAETPWNYVSVLEVDKYFSTLPKLSNQRIVIISPLPPFLFDFYFSRGYTILPLSKSQEFRDFKQIIWGPNNYDDLSSLYRSYINQGFLVYVAEYGMGNEVYLHDGFDQINQDFDLTIVHQGCFNACKLYQLNLK